MRRVTLVPLDMMRQLLFSPSDLLDLPAEDSLASTFLRQVVPYGIAASSNLYGVEGFYLKDVLGIVAVSQPELLSTKSMRRGRGDAWRTDARHGCLRSAFLAARQPQRGSRRGSEHRGRAKYISRILRRPLAA